MSDAEIIQAVTDHWLDCEYIGIRAQDGAEIRTKVGDALRPSCEWVDGNKTRRKLPGTAAFYVAEISKVEAVVEAMRRHGYLNSRRIVIVGSDTGCNGADMPERYASAFRDARILAIVGDAQ